MRKINNHEFNLIIILILVLGFVFFIYIAENPITRNVGDLSDWVGSLLTVAVIFVAIKQISNESELSRNEREYQEKEKRIDLASPIFCYIKSDDRECVVIENNTNYPIYDIIIGLVLIPKLISHNSNSKEKTQKSFWKLKDAFCMYRLNQVLPNKSVYIKIETHGDGMNKTEGVAMAFMDSRGNYWIRETYGELTNVKEYSDYFTKELPSTYIIVRDC